VDTVYIWDCGIVSRQEVIVGLVGQGRSELRLYEAFFSRSARA